MGGGGGLRKSLYTSKKKEEGEKTNKKNKKPPQSRWVEKERGGGGTQGERGRQTPSTGLRPPHSNHCHNRPIRKVTCSRETLASSHRDHVSPSTRPREFEISIKSIASSLCPRIPCLRTHRKYQTQLALSTLNNRKTLANGYRNLVSPSARPREFGISLRSIAYVVGLRKLSAKCRLN